MTLLLGFLALLPLQNGKTDAGTALVSVARDENPAERKKKLRAMRKTHRLSLASWERVIAQLPTPLVPTEKRETGRLHEVRARLWTGKKNGILDTTLSLFLPEGFYKDPEKRWPLLISNHGSGGDASGTVSQWSRLADRIGMIVVGADEQLENAGYRSSEQERLTQISLLRWTKLRFPVDNNRVFVSGVSRGGHIVWDLMTRYPDLWAGAIPMIGGPMINTMRGHNNLRLVRNLLDLPVRDLQGEQDDPGLLFNLRYAFSKLKDARDAKFITFPELGHSYRLSAVNWGEFFADRSRQAVPSRIRFWCCNTAFGRRSWLRVTKLGRNVKDAYALRVEASRWNRLDMKAKKRLVAKDAEKKTASIDARLQGSAGKRMIVIQSAKDVKAIQLLLPRKLWPGDDPKARIQVRYKGRTRKIKPSAKIETFLLDWCERLDLETAPVAVADVRL